MVLGHQAIDAHHPVRVTVQPARIAQQEVIRMGIERIGLEPPCVVHAVARAAKFGHEDVITQALRRAEIVLRAGQRHMKGWCVLQHEELPGSIAVTLVAGPVTRNGVGLTGNTRPAARIKALSTIGCDAYSSKTGSSETRDPSITTLPTSRKFTVILSPIFDCTCPTPQSGSPG